MSVIKLSVDLQGLTTYHKWHCGTPCQPKVAPLGLIRHNLPCSAQNLNHY